MAGEYVSECGCKINVIQWSSKRKVVTQKSCPLHKHAKELLEALKCHGPINCTCKFQPYVGGPIPCVTCQVKAIIAKAEGRPE